MAETIPGTSIPGTSNSGDSASGTATPVRLVRDLVSTIPHGRRRLALSVLLAALASGASVALMGVSAWLLSRAAEHPPVLYLEAAAVGVRFFGISRGVFRYGERLVSHDLALRMESSLRLRTYDRLSRTTLLGGRRGDLLVRVIADVAAVQDVVVRVAIPFLSAGVVILGTSLMLAMFSPADAAVLLGTAVLAGWLVPWLGQLASRRADQAAVPGRGRLGTITDELAHAATDVTMSGDAATQLARFDAVDADLRRAERRGAAVRGIAAAGQMVCAGVAVIAALVIGSHEVAAGHLLGRDLAVLVLTPLALHEVFGEFTSSAQVLTRARTALARVGEVLSAPLVGSGDQSMTPTGATDLAVDHLSAGWPGFPPVQEGISFRIAAGERLGLVGPSGIGKTTVAATVMGLIPPVAGSVESPGAIGYLAQDAHIFATSLAENVRIGRRDATDEQIAAALHDAGLELDPERVVGEDGATLSGGEVRRVALARVLVGLPDSYRAVILDEPTEHLDRDTADALMADLWSALDQHPVPVLVITHDPEVMSDCTSVLRLGQVD